MSVEWDPGSLGTRELERILIDVLADIWQDCYRRGAPMAQRREFRRALDRAVYSATSIELSDLAERG